MSLEDPKSAILNNVSNSINDAVPRRSANFQPSVWGDYFLSYHSNSLLEAEDDAIKRRHSEMKKEVRNMIIAAGEKCWKKLSLIDSIQRLGLSYHFEGEINEILEHIHDPCNVDPYEDLYIASLRFRLLRQQGYFVSCEIFTKFTNERGKFKESIAKDERGLLSLYEASHLRINGENILEEALTFTTTHLQEIIAMNPSSSLGEEVKYALKWPMFKAYPRLMTKDYISFYHKDPLYNNVLLTLAKLDYNLLQKLYQKEVGELSRWLKDLRLMEELSFARNRTVECYVWALGIFYEPKYSRANILLAKAIMLISFLDDMYDVYATLDELELFTDAIERWDINDMENLPNYMKVLYEAIYGVYRVTDEDICKDKTILFALDYAKEEMKRLCKVYLQEAKWFHEGYVPSMEEYMKVATITSSYYVFASISFLGMGGEHVIGLKKITQWTKNDPMLLQAIGVIGRLMNDITSHKFEQERGDVASAVECYMKQYGEAKEEVVVVELEKQVVNAWKNVTEDYIKSPDIPSMFLVRLLNAARASDLFYKEEDGYTVPDGATKRFISSLLIDPMLV